MLNVSYVTGGLSKFLRSGASLTPAWVINLELMRNVKYAMNCGAGHSQWPDNQLQEQGGWLVNFSSSTLFSMWQVSKFCGREGFSLTEKAVRLVI